MLTRTTSHHAADHSESLQTDVMRFMAIIGFCLIAILALVKNVEPTAATVATVPQQPTVRPAPVAPVEEPEPESKPARAEAPPVSPPAPPPATAPIVTPAISSTTEQSTAADRVMDKVAEQVLEPEAPAAAAPVQAQEQGLILRFASDGDFLRLIARGDITVYAFFETDVLSLSEGYRFLDSASPGQVYELLRASIPGLIVDALQQERADIRSYRWGIELPARISSKIERYLGNVTTGQLVIDRYGDVRHVAAS